MQASRADQAYCGTRVAGTVTGAAEDPGGGAGRGRPPGPLGPAGNRQPAMGNRQYKYIYIYIHIQLYIKRRPNLIPGPILIIGPNLILWPNDIHGAPTLFTGPASFPFTATFCGVCWGSAQ